MSESTTSLITGDEWEAVTEHAFLLGARYAEGLMIVGIDPWALPESPLSGEWADEPTVAEILAAVLEPSERKGIDAESVDEVMAAWLRGYAAEQSAAIDRAGIEADRSNRGIVSYAYQAEEVRHQDLIERIYPSWSRRGILSPAALDASAEDVLDQAAAYLGIDRIDESTFDSDDFPKIGRLSDGSWVA